MEEKLKLIGLKPIKIFKTPKEYIYMCEYYGYHILIKSIERSDNVIKLVDIGGGIQIIDHDLIDSLEELRTNKYSIGVITEYGIYLDSISYTFPSYEKKRRFDIALVIEDNILPQEIIDEPNMILQKLYLTGIYRMLEEDNAEYDIYIPKNRSEMKLVDIISHIAYRNAKSTLDDFDVSKVTPQKQIRLAYITIKYIDEPIVEGKKMRTLDYDLDRVFNFNHIEMMLKDAKCLKQKYIEQQERYNAECQDLIYEIEREGICRFPEEN